MKSKSLYFRILGLALYVGLHSMLLLSAQTNTGGGAAPKGAGSSDVPDINQLLSIRITDQNSINGISFGTTSDTNKSFITGQNVSFMMSDPQKAYLAKYANDHPVKNITGYDSIIDKITIALGSSGSQNGGSPKDIQIPPDFNDFSINPFSSTFFESEMENSVISKSNLLLLSIHLIGDQPNTFKKYYAIIKQGFIVKALGVSAYYVFDPTNFSSGFTFGNFFNTASVSVATDIFSFQWNNYKPNGIHTIALGAPTIFTVSEDPSRNKVASIGIGASFNFNDKIQLGTGYDFANKKVYILIGTQLGTILQKIF